ncbi:MAG: DNA-binding protein [Oscillospiraceae bacterium]|nr:DNA-binding protein [Oscillospiraceae bacterium]
MSKDLNMSYLLDFYGNVLTEKQRDMMQQYYHMDLSLSEIADNFGITRQGVRDSIKRGENILTELEEQVGFAEKYKVLTDGISKIKTYAQNIAFYNSASYTTNDDIHKAANDIMRIIDTLAEQEG